VVRHQITNSMYIGQIEIVAGMDHIMLYGIFIVKKTLALLQVTYSVFKK
jgi:hypothetical protein